MCPGLTSKGGKLPEVGKEKTVVILAESKINPIGIGYTTMLPQDMKRINKGIGLELITHIGDATWFIK